MLLYEIFFWLYLFYTLFSNIIGINIPYLGIIWLLILAGIATVNLKRIKRFHFPIILIFSISFTFLLIQLIFHNMSIMDSYLRPFISWVLFAFVLSFLFIQKNFLKHVLVVMFLILLFLSPFFVFKGNSINDVVQVRLYGTGIDNPNDLAAWIGFCALGFWLWSVKSKSKIIRLVLIVCVAISLIILGVTVSRGSLIALLVGIFVSFRQVSPKRWLGLLLIMIFVGLIISQVPITKQSIFFYQERIFQETGRLLVWSVILSMIIKAPLIGYGVENISQFVQGKMHNITPHNGIFFLGMAAGLIPLVPFLFLWFSSIRKVLLKIQTNNYIDPFPLLLYAFLQMIISNLYFMAFWCVVTIIYVYSLDEKGFRKIQRCKV